MSSHDGGALLTEFYQLTAHHAPGLFRPGHGGHGGLRFEFFVRKLPTGRNFLIAAGLEQALDYLEGLRFTPEELD